MLHYDRVDNDLRQAEKTIRTALKSADDTLEEKKALEEALGLVEKAEEICRMAQRESIVTVVTQSMEM